jgi:transcription elongation factor GreA
VLIQTGDTQLEQFTIVGVAETNPADGLISNESLLGQALLGHKIGEELVFVAPDGEHHFRIIAVT